MRRIGLAVHRFRVDALDTCRSIVDWARTHDLGVVADASDVPFVDSDYVEAGDFGSTVAVVSVGGDGTMLRAVRSLEGAAIPILGVNMGSLGYLATLEAATVTEALERFLLGEEGVDFEFDDRMMLDVSIWSNGALLSRHLALNEVVVEKKDSGHTVRLGVDIDRAPFTTYSADGLIVSTPTGSTAYSMSARGPILSPKLRALLVTPVSPHMLFDRSMVLDAAEAVRIEVQGHRSVTVATDGGLVHTLKPGDVVEVAAASAVARFVRFGHRRFHETLKSKFGLEDR